MIRRFLPVFVLLCFGFAVPNVMACSGYPYFGVEDLPRMELLVKATVIEADSRGDSAILLVDEYYKGEGGRLLTIMRYRPALYSGAYVRGYDTGCLYAGQGDSLFEGGQGYFGLKSNGDGTFTDYDGGTADFYAVDGRITYQEGYTEGYAAEFDDPLQITEDEFVGKLLEAGNRDEPVEPTSNFYPLLRFLSVTTENGTRYQVNPDRSVTEIPEDAPLAISPDGAHVAFKADDETIVFQYIWTTYRETEAESDEDEIIRATLKKPGQAVAFSGDSNFVTVWDSSQLGVYMFSNEIQRDYGNEMMMIDIAQIELATSEALPDVSWSPDGSTLVWETDSGIWHWNIFEAAEPQQFDAKGLLDVSMYGRYLRAGQPDEWTLIDTQTGETHANAIAAPTEHFLIFVKGTDGGINSWSGERVGTTSANCKPPLRENCATYLYESDAQFVFPYRLHMVGLYGCDEEEGCRVNAESWHPAIGRTDYFSPIGASMDDVRQITYDARYNMPAILVGDYQIYFWFYSNYAVEQEENQPYLDILDLEDQLDSPIASIEWGQPVFYDPYQLTTFEHLPR